jgi:predicted AAA+ superfamily ATPase
LVSAPEGTHASYWRTSGGAEIDLLLELPVGERWAIEIKRSLAPSPSRDFHKACDDLKPQHRFVVYPGSERFPVRAGAEAIPPVILAAELTALRK